VAPNEVVIVIGFELKLTSRAGTMNLCIPYNVIEPVMEQLSSQSWFNSAKHIKSKESTDRMTDNLSRAPLAVHGLLAQTTITVKELLELSPGDVIVTEKASADPAVLCVEGEEKFVAHLGQFKGKRALKVVGPKQD
jgi:flagellar motor switch protein FliM